MAIRARHSPCLTPKLSPSSSSACRTRSRRRRRPSSITSCPSGWRRVSAKAARRSVVFLEAATILQPPSQGNAHGISALPIEYFHDVCLVRAFEVQRCAALAGDARKLAVGIVRIHVPGARQPLGQRQLFYWAAQDYPGDHRAHGVYRLRSPLYEAEHHLELPGGIYVLVPWRVLHLQRVAI